MKNELMNIKLGTNNTIKSMELLEIINHFRQEEEKSIKEHKTLMRDIRKEIENLNNAGINQNNFVPVEYIDLKGENRPCFELDEEGMLIILNKESTLVRYKTVQYIKQLKEENKKLKETISEKDRLLLGLFSDDKMVVAQSHKALVELEKKPLLDKIEEDKPKVTFADTIIESSDTIDISKLAKLVKDENIPLGRNKLFQWLRDNKYLMKDNIPYQRYIDMKLFECKEYTYKTPYGDKNGIKTLVTGKGQVYIVEKLKECFK